MVGRLTGVATQLEKEAHHKIYRVWCGLHQLDLIMKYAYAKIKDGEFNTIMSHLTDYLRRQYNFIAEIQAICPKATTRWTAVGNTCKWLIEKRITLLEYFAKDNPARAPPSWWWIIVAAVSALSEQVNIVVVKLQGKDLLLSQQTTELEQLAALILVQIEIDGPLSQDEIAIIDKTTHFTFSRWSVSYEKIILFLYDQGLFIQQIYEQLSPESQIEVIRMIATFILYLVDGILNIQAERDSANKPADNLPPVLPHQLVKIRGRDFTNIVSDHLNHLKQFWDEELIDRLERQYRQLRVEYQNDVKLKSALDNCDGNTSFETGWSIIKGRDFDVLRDFCGGIATLFANTASVESDFSILGWEKDEYRKSLTDLSLEGIMQCKQFELLSSLV
jgi:hypothetical protein